MIFYVCDMERLITKFVPLIIYKDGMNFCEFFQRNG